MGEHSGAGPEYTATRLSSSVALCVDLGLVMAPRLALDVVVMEGSVALALSSLGRRRRSGRGDSSLLRTPSASRTSRGTAAIFGPKLRPRLGLGKDEADGRASLPAQSEAADRLFRGYTTTTTEVYAFSPGGHRAHYQPRIMSSYPAGTSVRRRSSLVDDFPLTSQACNYWATWPVPDGDGLPTMCLVLYGSASLCLGTYAV